jgi:hypothetical protein
MGRSARGLLFEVINPFLPLACCLQGHAGLPRPGLTRHNEGELVPHQGDSLSVVTQSGRHNVVHASYYAE